MQRNSSSDNDITLHTNNIKKIYEDHFTEESALRMDLKLYAEFADEFTSKKPEPKYLDHLNQLLEKLDRDMNNIGPETITSSRLEVVSTMTTKTMGSFPDLIKDILNELKGNYDVVADRTINSIYEPINTIINEGEQLYSALEIKMQEENKQQKSSEQRRKRTTVVTPATLSLDPLGDVAPPHVKQKSKAPPRFGLIKSGLFNKPEKDKDKRPKSAPTLPEKHSKDSPNPRRRK